MVWFHLGGGSENTPSASDRDADVWNRARSRDHSIRQSKRKMTYTLAMVDEGLLDLTRFKNGLTRGVPRFYAREALGVRTWDVYDAVDGSIRRKIERLLAMRWRYWNDGQEQGR